MSTKTMGSQGGGRQQSQFQNLPRQGSMYNLTLNEVQSQLGEPLHSMNLDELLRNVLPPDGDQPLELDISGTSVQLAPSCIQRQGSVALSWELSKKTVDEVWKDIQQGCGKSSNEKTPAHERQSTLGEMTLEDFLVKAGVVTEGLDKTRTNHTGNLGSSGNTNSMIGTHGYPQGIHWLQQYHAVPPLQKQVQLVQQRMVAAYASGHLVQQPAGVATSSMLGGGYTENQLTSSTPMMGTLLNTQTPGQKKVAPGEIAEKMVERRQKRMIKNRESAARSRARKQAYTNELENKVNRLEEENEKLRKQKMLRNTLSFGYTEGLLYKFSSFYCYMKTRISYCYIYCFIQELDRILYSVPPPNPKFQLRRTSSSPI